VPKETFFNLPEDKRQRIVELAIEEFAVHPYGAASLSRIVARAGIAKGSIYQYFENKLDLYRWLVLEEVPRRKLAYLSAPGRAPQGDVFAVLEGFIVSGIELTARDARLSGLIANFARSTDPEVIELFEQNRAQSRAYLRAMLERAQAAGSLRAELDLDLAADFVSHVLGEALLEGITRRLGIGRAALMADPTCAERLPVEERLAMARGLIDVLRRGIGRGAEQGS
jgi:AcrR family transcriptional regulator